MQQVYEVILDTELLKANFRRKVSDRVVETNEYTKTWDIGPPNYSNSIQTGIIHRDKTFSLRREEDKLI